MKKNIIMYFDRIWSILGRIVVNFLMLFLFVLLGIAIIFFTGKMLILFNLVDLKTEVICIIFIVIIISYILFCVIFIKKRNPFFPFLPKEVEELIETLIKKDNKKINENIKKQYLKIKIEEENKYFNNNKSIEDKIIDINHNILKFEMQNNNKNLLTAILTLIVYIVFAVLNLEALIIEIVAFFSFIPCFSNLSNSVKSIIPLIISYMISSILTNKQNDVIRKNVLEDIKQKLTQ